MADVQPPPRFEFPEEENPKDQDVSKDEELSADKEAAGTARQEAPPGNPNGANDRNAGVTAGAAPHEQGRNAGASAGAAPPAYPHPAFFALTPAQCNGKAIFDYNTKAASYFFYKASKPWNELATLFGLQMGYVMAYVNGLNLWARVFSFTYLLCFTVVNAVSHDGG